MHTQSSTRTTRYGCSTGLLPVAYVAEEPFRAVALALRRRRVLPRPRRRGHGLLDRRVRKRHRESLQALDPREFTVVDLGRAFRLGHCGGHLRGRRGRLQVHRRQLVILLLFVGVLGEVAAVHRADVAVFFAQLAALAQRFALDVLLRALLGELRGLPLLPVLRAQQLLGEHGVDHRVAVVRVVPARLEAGARLVEPCQETAEHSAGMRTRAVAVQCSAFDLKKCSAKMLTGLGRNRP